MVKRLFIVSIALCVLVFILEVIALSHASQTTYYTIRDIGVETAVAVGEYFRYSLTSDSHSTDHWQELTELRCLTRGTRRLIRLNRVAVRPSATL